MFDARFLRLLALCAAVVCFVPLSLHAALGVSSVFPANAATGVCIDTPLRITFDAAPTVGTSGRIIVTNSGGTVVDTIDLSSATQTRTIGGTVYNYRPVIVAGNTAIITLHTAVLAYGQTYRVTVEGEALRDTSGVAFAGIGAGSWSFSTKSAGPAAGTSSLTVAADGTGDFASVQGAFDFVPVNNSKPVLINLRNGTYHEILLLRNRPFVTLRGEDRRQTVITYANNANFNSGNNRCMVGIDSNDFTLERLTLRNSTPTGGSQAEALRTNSTRCYVSNCDFSSYQDTLLINGAVYFTNCYIEGDVDFIWGSGVAYFYRCETRALRRGYNVQSRSDTGKYGFIFVECAVTAADGVTNHVLARTDTTSFPELRSRVSRLRARPAPHRGRLAHHRHRWHRQPAFPRIPQQESHRRADRHEPTGGGFASDDRCRSGILPRPGQHPRRLGPARFNRYELARRSRHGVARRLDHAPHQPLRALLRRCGRADAHRGLRAFRHRHEGRAHPRYRTDVGRFRCAGRARRSELEVSAGRHGRRRERQLGQHARARGGGAGGRSVSAARGRERCRARRQRRRNELHRAD